MNKIYSLHYRYPKIIRFYTNIVNASILSIIVFFPVWLSIMTKSFWIPLGLLIIAIVFYMYIFEI